MHGNLRLTLNNETDERETWLENNSGTEALIWSLQIL